MNIFARYRVSMIKTVCGRAVQTTPMTMTLMMMMTMMTPMTHDGQMMIA